jgi:hypothetical protein
MTHAIYAFLLPIDDLGADDEILVKEVKCLFEDRFDDRLNENNWYQEECLVLRNGRVVNLCPESGSRDEVFRIADEVPQEERYKWARLTALQCVATELELGGRPSFVTHPCQLTPMEAYWDDFDSLVTQIMLEVPPRLAALWAKGPMLPPTGDWLERHRRSVWGRQMEMLLHSLQFHEPPFTGDGFPIEYRAFDLTWGGDKDHHAILFVDIHS